VKLVDNKKINDVLKKVVNICKNNAVSHLYLFGSYAKKTERPGSDLDIVVKGVKDINKLKDEIDDIRTLTIINLFNYDKIKNNFLKEDIDAYAKIIY
jgi:predicted nucleotidyltransferase